MMRRPPRSTPPDTRFPYTPLFRSGPDRVARLVRGIGDQNAVSGLRRGQGCRHGVVVGAFDPNDVGAPPLDPAGPVRRDAAVKDATGGPTRESGGCGDGESMVAVAGAAKHRQAPPLRGTAHPPPAIAAGGGP